MSSLLLDLASAQFAYPFAFALPLALLLGLLVSRNWAKPFEIFVAAPASHYPSTFSARKAARLLLLPTLLLIALLSLTAAAARPQKLLQFSEPEERRNIMLILDLSRSMLERDFGSGFVGVSRFEGVRTVVKEFVSRRAGDRLGIVIFGDQAFLQAPLTVDHEVLLELLSQVRVGHAGNGTAMGDGLGLALKRLQNVSGDTKAAILLSDGVSNAGSVNPLQAAKVASDLEITVHTIGIGSSQSQNSAFQRMVRKHGADEETLRKIASETGGVFFNANDIQKLRLVYDEIDKLEKSEAESPQQNVPVEYFWSYLSLSLIAYLFYLLLARGPLLRIP